jgi:hypothetical protein
MPLMDPVIRIQEAQKHTDPDPQYWIKVCPGIDPPPSVALKPALHTSEAVSEQCLNACSV